MGDASPQSTTTTPWYETNLIWVPISIGLGTLPAVIAAMKHDLRWLLIISWICFVVAAWVAARRTVPIASWLYTFIAGTVFAVSLGGLNIWLRPTPTAPEIRVEMTRPPEVATPKTEEPIPETSKPKAEGVKAPAKPLTQPEIEMSAYLQPEGQYPNNMLIAGILWDAEKYFDIRVDVSVKDVDIYNVDLLMDFQGADIAAMGQLSQIGGVSFFPATPSPIGAVWLGGDKPSDGKPLTSFPVTHGEGLMQTAPTYRIQCDHLHARTILHILVASTKLTPAYGSNGEGMIRIKFDHIPPNMISVHGTYTSTVEANSKKYQYYWERHFTQR
jgi:hypothetical protein